MEKKAIRCCLCDKIIWSIESNNPWPAREYSVLGSTENRCCHSCNQNIVAPLRIGLINASEEQVEELHNRFKKMSFYELDSLVVETKLPKIEMPEKYPNGDPKGEPTEDDLV